MIVLLVSNDINHLVYRIILKAHIGCSDILRHVNRSAVASEQQLLIQSFVSKICPYTVVILAKEKPFGEPFLYLLLALEVCIRFIINLVEAYT